MSVSVCLSVCLCVCLPANISPELYMSDLRQIFVRATNGRVSVSSGGFVIRYVLPVFLDDVIIANKLNGEKWVT